ncbi:MAG: DUF2958 domain-containing protein [Candidatus Saccharimonas sp.]
MKLLTKAAAAKIPKLYATEHIETPDKIAYAKFFHPVSQWTWYVMEYDGADTCFGLVVGHETEFGYFSLEELSLVGYGLPIERDRYFKPTRVKDLLVHEIERVAA